MAHTLLSKNSEITNEEGDELGCSYEQELRLVGRDGLEEKNISNFARKRSINGDNSLLAQFRCRSNMALRHRSSVLRSRL